MKGLSVLIMGDILKRKYDYFIGFVALLAFAILLIENTIYLKPYAFVIGEINLVISLIFVLDILLRYFSCKNRKNYILRNWIDLIVFVPFIQLTRGIENTPFFVIVRYIVIIAILISRVRQSLMLIGLLSLKPAQMMIATFAFAIGVGTALLMLPVATQAGIRTSLTDALFTATSATCVTGLTVRDTGAYFSFFGQIVILALIQIGGLGIMTFSISLALIMGKRMDMKQEVMMSDMLDQSSLAQVRHMIMYIFKMTFICEAAGAVILFIAWMGRTGGIIKTAYFAVFHSVSAFCNAGFSTFSGNLIRFREDMATNAVICGLIIAGGLGFTVIKDLHENIKMKLDPAKRRKIQLKVQTRTVLWMSGALIVLGALALYILEKDASFLGFSFKGKVLASVFQSVTARTAGFNSCSIAGLSGGSLLILMALMFIGGSPGSTAGGVKTTTVSVLLSTIVSEFRGRENTEMFKRTIPVGVIKKALVMFGVSSILVAVFAALLLFFEQKQFSSCLFETISAFGTVGLSADLTESLSTRGKLLMTILMFIGRLGPLTIGYAFLRRHAQPRYEYARESVAIG
jgi:trk system potassium uptake protein TrkH